MVPFLEMYQSRLQSVQRELVQARKELKRAKHSHRGSIVSLHNKMFKKLLDAEESHESDVCYVSFSLVLVCLVRTRVDWDT